MGQKLDRIEKYLIRTAVGVLAAIIIYGVLSSIIISQVENKSNQVQAHIDDTTSVIAEVIGHTVDVQDRTQDYERVLE